MIQEWLTKNRVRHHQVHLHRPSAYGEKPRSVQRYIVWIRDPIARFKSAFDYQQVRVFFFFTVVSTFASRLSALCWRSHMTSSFLLFLGFEGGDRHWCIPLETCAYSALIIKVSRMCMFWHFCRAVDLHALMIIFVEWLNDVENDVEWGSKKYRESFASWDQNA